MNLIKPFDARQANFNGSDPVITVRNLVKRYGDFVAVNDISFEVQRGEIFGIVGPNGAGKTSAVESVMGVRWPLTQAAWFNRAWSMAFVWILLAILVVGGVLSARLFRWE